MNNCEHEFIDIYDETENIHQDIVKLVEKNISYVENIIKILNDTKIKTKKYNCTYCKKCGFKVGQEGIKKINNAMDGLEII